MAAPKKPSKRAKTRTSRSGSARKKPAAKKASASAKRAPTPKARKASAKTARKAAPKSGSKAQARAAAAAIPEIEEPRTALVAKAESTEPSLRPGRKRSTARWLAVAGILAAIVLVIVLIASGGDDNNTTVADTTPATTPVATTPTATATAPAVTTPTAAVPAAKPVVRTETCDPIIGSGTANSGQTYDVTSSAKDGDPAACSEAHSVLLSALQGGGTRIGDWSCRTDPSGNPVASCTSTGGRSIQATG